MNQNQYGKNLIQSLVRLSGVPDDQMLDFLIGLIKSHNLAPELISIGNIKEILEKEINNMVLHQTNGAQLNETGS